MFSIDIRRIAIHIYSLIHSLRKTAILVQSSHMSIARWIKNIDRKVYQTRKQETHKSKLIVEIIRSSIVVNPLTSASKLRDMIKSSLSLVVSKELIRVVIGKLGLTRKKTRFYGMTKKLPEQTTEFLQKRTSFMNDKRHFVSIDETAFGRNGIVTNGYSKKGTPLYVRKKAPRVTTVSVVVCVSKHGLVKRKKIVGAFNTVEFLDFLQSMELPEKTVILLDNVRFHHSKVVKHYAETQQWDLLYVPPYSPWFNPIEMCFSIVKRKFYYCGDIDHAFDQLTASHCKAFFEKSCNTVNSPI